MLTLLILDMHMQHSSCLTLLLPALGLFCNRLLPVMQSNRQCMTVVQKCMVEHLEVVSEHSLGFLKLWRGEG